MPMSGAGLLRHPARRRLCRGPCGLAYAGCLPRAHWTMPSSPPPRVATLVLCTPAGEVLGQLRPFQASLPWWQEASDLVARVREEHGVDVTILRVLDPSLPAPPGGRVTYLAEVDGARAGGLPLTD